MGSSKDTILIYGFSTSPAISLIYRSLLERNNRKVYLIPQETFLESTYVSISLNDSAFGLSFTLPGGATIGDDQLVSICLENQFVFVTATKDVSDKDLTYVRMEGWALLLAITGGLQETCLVANPAPRIDFTQSRAGAIMLLQKYGIPAPRMKVTSDPDVVRSFYQEMNGQVICKHVKEADHTFKQLTAEDMERAERTALCPVQIEEYSPGYSVRVVVAGSRVFSLEERQQPGGMLQLFDFTGDKRIEAKCARLTRDLGLAFCEYRLRKTPEGNWHGLGIHPFVSAPSLQFADPSGRNPVLDAAAECLESGVIET